MSRFVQTVVRQGGCGALVLALVLGTGCEQRPAVVGPQEKHYITFRRSPRFEPSGVAMVDRKGRFLVASDKKDMEHLTVFQLDLSGPGGGVGEPRLVECVSFDVDAKKLEGVTASRKEPGTFYLTTAFDRPGEHDSCITKIRLDGNGKLASQEVIPICPPVDVCKKLVGQPWSKTEALALSADERHLIMGLRAIGPNFKDPEFRVVLLKYSLSDPTAEPEAVVNVSLAGKDVTGRTEGTSGLEYSPALGKYLLLTSYEARDIEVPREQVSGHLWILPVDLSSINDEAKWKSLPRVALGHKPEGVAPMPNTATKALVIFDDDDDRKSPTGEGGMFRLRRNEAAFRVVDLP